MSENLNNEYPGLFIAFEGTDFTGKSTISKAVKDRLASLGYKVHWTREPGGSDLAEKIRSVIINEYMDSLTEAFLFAAARNDHYTKTILPKLKENVIVISDRFFGSSYVYQGVVSNQLEKVKKIHELIGNPTPDHVFLVTTSSCIINERMKARSDNNRLDSFAMNNILKMNKGYLEYISETPNNTEIANNSDIESAVSLTMYHIEKLIEKKGIKK